MNTRQQIVVALAFAGSMLTACSTHAMTGGPPVTPGSASALEAAARAAVDAKLDAGYVFQVSGTVHSIDVALGKPPTFRLGHGDVVDVKLVPNTEPRYRISGPHGSQRNVLALPPACDGCDNGGSATPNPQSTPPPNYGPCSSSGGATWYNGATGDGGCTPRGSTKPLSCGTWSWSSRGKGTLIVPGTGTFPDLDYVVDNNDGSCRLGFI